MDAVIKPTALQSDLAGSRAPLVIDVRKSPIPYDIPDVAFTHDGELCSFDGHSAWKAIGGAIKPITEESPEIKV